MKMLLTMMHGTVKGEQSWLLVSRGCLEPEEVCRVAMLTYRAVRDGSKEHSSLGFVTITILHILPRRQRRKKDAQKSAEIQRQIGSGSSKIYLFL